MPHLPHLSRFGLTGASWAPAAEVTLTQGKNSLRLSRPAESRGLTIKEFTLTPLK